MSSMRRSTIWNSFTHIDSESARCDLCLKQLSIKGGATNNLLKHAKRKHPEADLLNENKNDEVKTASNIEFFRVDIPENISNHLSDDDSNVQEYVTDRNDSNKHTSEKSDPNFLHSYYKAKLKLLEEGNLLIERDVIANEKFALELSKIRNILAYKFRHD